MTPDQAKLKQREDARIRSRQAPRRASSQAVSSDQSEVTEEAPAVYRVPQINVPEDLQGVARLIQTELAKIEQSQTILLSLWEKTKAQAMSDSTHLRVNAGIDVYTDADQKIRMYRPSEQRWNYMEWRKSDDSTRDAYIGVVANTRDFIVACEYGSLELNPGLTSGSGSVKLKLSGNGAPLIFDSPFTYGQDNEMVNVYMKGVLRWAYGAYKGNWDIHTYDDSGAWVAQPAHFDNSTGQFSAYGYVMARASTVDAQINMSIALTREELKAEIYAELLELNPGIAIPKTA